MKVKMVQNVTSSDKVDSKFDYKKFIVSGKNKNGRFVSKEIYETQGEYITLKSRQFFPTIEAAFDYLTQ